MFNATDGGAVDQDQNERPRMYLPQPGMRRLPGESIETFAKRIGGMWELRNMEAAERAREEGESTLVVSLPLIPTTNHADQISFSCSHRDWHVCVAWSTGSSQDGGIRNEIV